MNEAISRRGVLGAVAGILAGLGLSGSGCSGHHQSNPPSPSTAMATAPAGGMKGAGTFFAGRLSATITISRGLGRGAAANGSGGTARHGHHGGAAEDSDAAATSNGGSLPVDGPMTPLVLHLKFENRSKQTLTFSVEDFESDLGHFSVHPGVLSLSPEQSAEPDAMTSKLGVISDDIPVKLALKLEGGRESQTIVVKNFATSDISDWPGLR